MRRRIPALVLILMLLCGAARAMTRDEMRAQWQALIDARDDQSPYARRPDLAASDPGALTDAACADALACLNFLRAVAGLDSVSLSPLYALRAQNAAFLLAANDELTHAPAKPEGMDESLYQSAYAGASMGNIAKFNWMRQDILIDGVTYFARDDGDSNLRVLGHRRWLLNPAMAETGFGLANAQSGMSYVTMYAVDDGNAACEWDAIAWPSAGVFPVELMRQTLPWSISLNPKIYDLDASHPTVLLREENSGAEFHFDPCDESGDGVCAFSRESCGSGPCVIFRPQITFEYEQNQRWQVEIGGLTRCDGSRATIAYTTEMYSLYPQDAVNVELSQIEAELAVGESRALQAQVIPAYADDLRILWQSSDESVAAVDANGIVTAVGIGDCEIIAASANGRSDVCAVRVK